MRSKKETLKEVEITEEDLTRINKLIKGKFANIVIYNYLGTPCIRTRPRYMPNPKTPKQQAHRFHLRATVQTLSLFKEAIHSGYINLTYGHTWSNALKHHYPLTHEQTPGNNDWTLNLADIALTNGTQPLNISLTANTNGLVQGDWDTPTADNSIYEEGKLVITLFNETKHQADTIKINFNDGYVNTRLQNAAGSTSDSLHLYYFAVSTSQVSATTYIKINP